MSKVFRFIYDSEYDENEPTEYPEATTIKARHYFSEGTTWPVILYQFAKFLEGTGYVGVVEKIQIADKYGVHTNCGFETFVPEEVNVRVKETNDYFEQDILEALDKEDKDAN